MESPVVLDKPPEYHGKDDRGFPFEEEEGAWSDLDARHPDIAARLRQHPAAANWARKRRPASQDTDEFGDTFSNFDRFPFEDIPPEFREHFPSHFNRRFSQREERAPQQPQSPQPQTSQSPPQQQTIATQTEHDPPEPAPQHTSLPQYGLRNTVDLGQKSAADPSLVDADERNQRSVSAPPESRNHAQKMSAQNHQEPPHGEHTSQAPKVRNIPIIVEGRDEPVINDTLDSASHFGDTKPTYHHPQQQPLDNSYFAEDAAPYKQPANFSKAFGSPYSKNYKGSQPFAQQKVYPQTYARGASPARSQSPKPKEEVKIPVQHEPPKPQARPEPPRPQPKPQQQQPPPQQQQQQQQQPPKQPTPPPASKPQPPDPITQILAIQTDVLNLMTEVEKFTGAKKDKRYIYLDEMLTRNLIKLDTIETEGKENIKNARKEAVKCIQKCIAVLEAKADSQSASAPQQENEDSQGHDAGMNAEGQTEQKPQNGEVDMKETGDQAAAAKPTEDQKPKEATPAPGDYKETPQATDTRPEEAKPEAVDNKPKKPTKVKVKSKDKSAERDQMVEPMQVDEKGENKNEPQQMEVDGAASQ